MNYEVYSYWNIAELQGVFNAIAALTASNDFTGLLRLLALVAIISLVLAVLSGRARHEDFWRWVIMLAVVNGVMLVPKATVVLVDRTSSQPNRVVANVPIGLAALAHGTSKIGDWLTRAFETVFALPNDLQFQKNGLMFGHRILTESVKLTPEIVNAAWARDFQEFWRECVMPDIASGYLSLDALRQAHDFWGMLNDTNPALYVTLSTVGIVNCPSAYANLTTRLNGVVVPAMIQLMADQQYPGVPANTAQMRNAISSAYAYGLGVVNTAESIVRQQMSINMAISAYCGTFAQLGDSNRAALCYSSSAGAYQTNYTYQVLAKIAESSMPKLKSAIEMIQYAVFPIILAFAIVAGHLGLGVIRAYVMSLVWVQLWPPLYAVIHYIQTSRLPEYANMLSGLGDTMQGQPDLLQLGVSDQAIAGMLVVAIPPIAAALVKGGEVGLQAVAGLVSAPKTAERQAADNAKGIEATGQWKTSPMVDFATSPQPVMARRNADGSYTYTHADGSTRYDASPMMDNIGANIRLGSKVSATASRQSKELMDASLTESTLAEKATQSALEKMAAITNEKSRRGTFSKNWSTEDAAAIALENKRMQDSVRRFAKTLGVSEEKATAIIGEVGGGLDLPIVKAKLMMQGISQSKLSDSKTMEEATALARQFVESAQKVHRITNSERYANDTSDGSSGMSGLRAALNDMFRHAEASNAAFRQALAYEKTAAYAEESARTGDVSLLRPFLQFMAEKGFSAEQVMSMAKYMPEELDKYIKEFTKLKADEMAAQVATPEQVLNKRNENVGTVNGKGDAETIGNRNLATVKNKQSKKGVTPGSGTGGEHLPGKIEAEKQQIEERMDQDRKTTQKQSASTQGEARQALSNPKLIAKALTNAIATLGDDYAYLAKYAAGDWTGTFANDAAKKYVESGGDLKTAVASVAVDAVMTVAGGLGGKVIGGITKEAFVKAAIEKAGQKVMAQAGPELVKRFPNLVNKMRYEAMEEAGKVAEKTFEALQPKMRNAGALAGFGASRAVTQPPGEPSVFDGAVKRGHSAAIEMTGSTTPAMGLGQPEGRGGDNPLTATPGGSNLGKVFGGGQRTVVIQQAPEQAGQESKKDDMPPPRR